MAKVVAEAIAPQLNLLQRTSSVLKPHITLNHLAHGAMLGGTTALAVLCSGQPSQSRPLVLEHNLPKQTSITVPPVTQQNLRSRWQQSPALAAPKAVLSPADRVRFQALRTQAELEGWAKQPYPQLIQTIAEQFVGASYKAGLLDQGDRETLILSLSEFDCVLFIETILALGDSILKNPPNQPSIAEATFANAVESYRYRDGNLVNYCSRLHYFSDWILDNQQRGKVASLTQLMDQPLGKSLSFMGNHRSSYPQLKSEAEYQCIREAEAKLQQQRDRIRYIPTSQISRQYNQLQPGDIIAVATSVSGLDVTHTGFVYQHSNGNLGLIHAAPNAGVIIAADLQTYIERVDSAIGILVARPQQALIHQGL